MIKELFLATIISTSISVRTPNDEDKPLDYEFSVKAEKNEGKFTFYEKVDYERELGENYIDITGKNVIDSIPKTIRIPRDEITKALSSSILQISDAIKQAFDHTPPEHSVDIMKNGIILTGGGALLHGLDIYIRNKKICIFIVSNQTQIEEYSKK